MMKQLYYLKNTDLGIERHNIGNVAVWMKGDINEWSSKIANLPMVTEALPPHYFPIVPTGPMMYTDINGWDGLNETTDETYSVGLIPSGKEFFDFYGLQLTEGEWLSEKNSPGDVIINETAALTFGWRNPVGKQFYSEYEHNRTYYTVVGVVKDFSYLPPTIAPRPLAFVRTEEQKYLWSRASILFKFTEEIAIRKVNGATIGSILQMFIKEYFVLLLVAALIAFPASYGMMRVWIESYVRQTSTPFWIYIVLFAGIGIIIVISIFWRVWNAAKQNPAEVVKTE